MSVESNLDYYDMLPDGYDRGQDKSGYIQVSKLSEGEHRMRILQKPICGWQEWTAKTGGSPIRYRHQECPKTLLIPGSPPEWFWMAPVWSYDAEKVCIITIKQTRLFKALTDLVKNEDWGDFRNYDIKIIKIVDMKKPEKFRNTYSISPAPPKSLSDDILKVVRETPINLEAIWDGGNPWGEEGDEKARVKCFFEVESEKPELKTITQADLNELEGIFADFPEYKTHTKDLLERGGLGHSLMDMPREMFASLKERAEAHRKEVQDNTNRTQLLPPSLFV